MKYKNPCYLDILDINQQSFFHKISFQDVIISFNLTLILFNSNTQILNFLHIHQLTYNWYGNKPYKINNILTCRINKI